MPTRDALVAIARAAVLSGGHCLRQRYHSSDRSFSYQDTDVTATADVAAERRMLPVIQTAFPEHAVYSEETGDHGGSAACQWYVDPLDGTNDYAAGMATFASAVAVEQDGKPVVAAVYRPIEDELVVAQRAGAVTLNEQPIPDPATPPVSASTVATLIGRSVPDTPALAEAFAAMESAIE